MASDSAALRLGWDIQNILYQHDDHPEDVPEHVVIDEIERLWQEYEKAYSEIAGHTLMRAVHPAHGMG